MTYVPQMYDKVFYDGVSKEYLYCLFTVVDFDQKWYKLVYKPEGEEAIEFLIDRPDLLTFCYNGSPKYNIGDEVCYFPFGVENSDFFVKGVIVTASPSLTAEPNTYGIAGKSIYRPVNGMLDYRESKFADAKNIAEAELADKYSGVRVSEKKLFVLTPTADATLVTLKHIKRVSDLMTLAATQLITRGVNHDASKLQVPESFFLNMMQHLVDTEGNAPYGSPEYKRRTAILKPMLAHHYNANSHHPEHFTNGIYGMNILDVIEMAMDWVAASERGQESFVNLTHAAERYNMSDQLKQIFANTYDSMGIKWK